MFNLFLFLVLNMPNLAKALNLENVIKIESEEIEDMCQIDVATSNIIKLALTEIFILFIT